MVIDEIKDVGNRLACSSILWSLKMSNNIKHNTEKSETKRWIPIFRKPKKISTQTKNKNLPTEQVLHLQRTIGNRAVNRLIRSSALQAKFSLGKPGDIYEKEADLMADRVMSMPETSLAQRKPTCPECSETEEIQTKPLAEQITPLVQRQAEEEEEVQAKQQAQRQTEEEEELQTKPLVQRQVEEEEEAPLQSKAVSGQTPEVSPNIESSIDAMKGGGQPLSESTRAFFEPRFGTDFSSVRVHTDSRAANTAQAINAKAFTTGKDIAFNSGQYSPGTSSGRKLLAHELTHVVQQINSKESQLSKKIIQTRRMISIVRDRNIGTTGCCVPNQNTCCTLGSASINGQDVGYTLELPDCNNQQSVSRIPAGSYRTTEEPRHSRFGYCLRLHSVPGRSGILIHAGNSPSDTEGCILPGQNRANNRCWVSNSRAALANYRRLINSDPDIQTTIS